MNLLLKKVSKFLKPTILSVAIIVASFNCSAQDTTYAREVIEKLTSKIMAGRGYVYDGDKKAAAYLLNEYKSIGLKPFGKQYFQPFEFAVNSITNSPSLKVNGIVLKPGIDYVFDPCTPSAKGKFKVKTLVPLPLDVTKIGNKKSALVIDKSSFDLTNPDGKQKYYETARLLKTKESSAGLIIEKEPKKFIYHVSQTVCERPYIKVLSDAWPKNVKKVKLKVENTFHESYISNNVVGFIEGSKNPDSFIVFTAHYDHLGMMGNETYFPGANDDASGTAMLLNLAKHYAQNPPEHSIVFIAFAAEEVGLLGSKYFVDNPLIDLSKIKFLINCDIVGTGGEGITVVNGSVFVKEFKKLVEINDENDYLIKVKTRGKARNSDHYWFTEAGVPSFFIYTMGGITAYHDVYDVPETLPLTEYEDLFMLIRDFVDSF